MWGIMWLSSYLQFGNLRVLLIHGKTFHATYKYVLEKVNKRITAWKSKILSPIGRLTLIKAVTLSIPIYIVQSVERPETVCTDLDMLNRNYFWGHTYDNNPIHLVNWEKTTCPKNLVGLGIKCVGFMNQAMLAKFGWTLLQNNNVLWANILRNKYLNMSICKMHLGSLNALISPLGKESAMESSHHT